MKLTTHSTKRALFVRIDGELDLHTAPQFRECVATSLEATPTLMTVVVVLSDVTFIDSSGLGALLGQYRHLASRGGRLVLVDPRPPVQRVLQFSGLLKLVDVVESEEKALLRA